MQEYVLFYSDRCQYCKEVYSDIMKNSLESHFILINIDNTSIKLPSFVEAVPLIFNKEQSKIYLEDDIDVLLGKMKSQTKIASVMSASDQLKGLTDKFSFIEGGDNDTMMSRGYNMLNATNNEDLLTPQITSKEGGGAKFDEKHYNSFLSQRDSDIASMFPRQNNVR